MNRPEWSPDLICGSIRADPKAIVLYLISSRKSSYRRTSAVEKELEVFMIVTAAGNP